MKFLKIENNHLYFQQSNYFGKLPISASKTVLDKLAESLTNQNGKPMDANLREIAGLTPKELYESFGDTYINVLMTQQNSVQVHEDEALSEPIIDEGDIEVNENEANEADVKEIAEKDKVETQVEATNMVSEEAPNEIAEEEKSNLFEQIEELAKRKSSTTEEEIVEQAKEEMVSEAPEPEKKAKKK